MLRIGGGFPTVTMALVTKIRPGKALHSQSSPAGKKKVIHGGLGWAHNGLSTIARTEVDANDAMDMREGEVRAFPGPCGGALGKPQSDRACEPETPRPEALASHYLKHRGVRASGLRPPSPNPEAHHRWRHCRALFFQAFRFLYLGRSQGNAPPVGRFSHQHFERPNLRLDGREAVAKGELP
jgi:hypothetical protein